MAKKHRDPQNQSSQSPSATTNPPNPNPNPNPSSIFDQLFGQTLQSEPTSALFSSHNPFRRKNPTQSPQSDPDPVQTQNHEDSDLKKRKRIKEKREDFGVESKEKFSGLALLGKKSKPDENPNLGNHKLEKLGNDEGKKKKRKRDELEREYEERKFGVEGRQDEEEKKGEVEGLIGRKRKAVEKENPELMKVTKDGYDDEEKLLRTVFVGNLPLKVKKKALLKEFSRFGEVESLRVRSVPTLDIKKPKKVKVTLNQINEAADSVHAYVVFKTQKSAEASLAHNMAVFEGNHIRVDRACPPRKKLKGNAAPLYDTRRTLFVGNLPFDVKDEELYQLFSGTNQEASVEAVRIIRDSATSLGKGIAYVLFKTREAANLFARRRDLKLRDRELRISRAKSDATPPTKRKYSSFGGTEATPSERSTADWKFPESGNKDKRAKADTSYQGLRASKSGTGKKAPSRTMKPVNVQSGIHENGERMKPWKKKRPAVAARKAKVLGMAMRTAAGGGGGVSNQGGKKRKMDARTPQSSNQKKKLKKSK